MRIWQVVLLLALSSGLLAIASRVGEVVAGLQIHAWQRMRRTNAMPSARGDKLIGFSRRFSQGFVIFVALYAYGMTAYLVITRGIK